MSALRNFAQSELFEPAHYHSEQSWGFFSILSKDHFGKVAQSSHRLSEMPRILSLVDTTKDTWLSQAEFMRPNRRVVNLLRIGLLFCDIDCYIKKDDKEEDQRRKAWAIGKKPDDLCRAFLYFCEAEGVPKPSIVVFSGRGLQVKWLLEKTIPRQALPRWNLCQREIVDRFLKYGADPAAKDASRVLRLVDTVNTRSGERCRVLHVSEADDRQPVRYNFEFLAEALLPMARWNIEKQQREREEKRNKFKLVDGQKKSCLRGFSGRTLAWHRLEDLRKLAELRGGVCEGQRMLHLHWQLNFLLLSGASNSNLMFHEAAELARQLSPDGDYRQELSTLYKKAQMFERGEKIEFRGKEYPALYTPKNDTLINLFQITDDEQRKLRTLISRDMAAERHNEREKARRRAAGAVDRASYLEAASAKQAQALALKAQGLSVRAIAAQMGISKTAAGRYIAEPGECPKSMRITDGEG